MGAHPPRWHRIAHALGLARVRQPMSAPRCQWCDRELRKRTDTVWFEGDRPTSREEAQRRTNLPILYIDWSYLYDKNLDLTDEREINRVHVWDGESYTGYPFHQPLFCTQRCAVEFAAASHRGGYRRKQS